MTVLIVVGVVAAACLLYTADRLTKTYRRARQRRQMAYRLTKAAARAEVAERQRKAAAAASAELTSVLPAINHPRPTFDGVVRQAQRTRTGRQHSPQGTGPQQVVTGPQRRVAAAGPSRQRCPEQPARPARAGGGQQHRSSGGSRHSAE